ncbi:UNVERIFIED_CONTAM: [SSU ribosomal protein S18P]-alanine acetyltransferase [Acetivibrio alkalicellulosi]
MNIDQVNICYMDLEDIDDVIIIENLCFTIPWSRESFIQEISNSQLTRYICAKVNDKMIGYAGMWKICDEGHITNIAVHPEYRRKGIGNKLVKGLISIAQKENLYKITLEVRKSNNAAQDLYARHGFRVEGLRKKYYSDNGEDAIIMWKKND